jgi:hypothetical protein
MPYNSDIIVFFFLDNNQIFRILDFTNTFVTKYPSDNRRSTVLSCITVSVFLLAFIYSMLSNETSEGK